MDHVEINTVNLKNLKLETEFTKMMKIQFPIIAAPMFLVSNEEIVSKVSECGGIGTFPALNYRPIEKYAEALKKIKATTKNPVGVNIIVNKSNQRQKDDLKIALDHGVEMFITSLGSPKEVIAEAHKNGAKVFCDVTNLEHALKVQDMGADGVIAVGSGAGGHAGPISPLVLIPWLKTKMQIPIIAAGGISHGSQMAAAFALGASAVSVGTRFIATTEAPVDQSYKDAVVKASPEDIIMTTKLSGTPAAVIKTDYVLKQGTELNFILKVLKNNSMTKKFAVPLIHLMGMKSLEQAANKPSWKTVWSAGQSVGLIDSVKPVQEVMESFITEYHHALSNMPSLKK